MPTIDMRSYAGPAVAPAGATPAMSDNPFDALSPEEFSALQDAAAAWHAGEGPSPAEAALEEQETAADEAGETDAEQQAEAASGAEMHSPEQMAEIASDAFDAISGCVDELESKLAAAKENEDSDPKAIEKLLKQAEDLRDEAEDVLADAKSAAADGDIGGAAEGAAECERLYEEATALVAEAADGGFEGTPTAPEEGETEAGDKPATTKPPAKPAPKKPAMAIWAARGD